MDIAAFESWGLILSGHFRKILKTERCDGICRLLCQRLPDFSGEENNP